MKLYAGLQRTHASTRNIMKKSGLFPAVISAAKKQFIKGVQMKDRVMLGLWKYMVSLPPFLVDMGKQLERTKTRFEAAAGFMTPDHRRVHHFVVRELPVAGKPLPPDLISEKLRLPRERVVSVLNDLEQHMTF